MNTKRNSFNGLSLLTPLLLVILMSLQAHAAALEGRIFNDASPIEGAKVYVYKNYEDIVKDTPLLISEPTDKQGVYKLDLSEGEYYFTAKGNIKGKEFFAYHGNNPVSIGDKENIWLTFMANESKPPVYSKGTTALKGVVTYKGKPVKDAFISIYTPETSRFKGLGFRTESVNEDGTFNLSVPYGKYIVIAKKMEGDNRIRPLKKGDLFCYYPKNPVEIKSNKAAKIEIPCYPKADRNSFSKVSQIKANDYEIVENMASKTVSGIRGKVLDIEGRPVPNVYVLGYRGEPTTVFMMFHVAHGTEYAGKTDSEGNYFLPIDSDGSFYLIARSTLGGSPHSGELYGLYGGNPWHFIRFNKGEVIENIDIVVGEAMDEKIRYKDKEVVSVNNAIYQTDYIIDTDTTWQGNISINGTIWIKRGVTLSIKPGTVIKFKRLDRDNNGIGDGEIIVEGRIIAGGTKENKIIFTSAEEKPEMQDWSYVLFLSTGSDSVIEYCDFQYAFSALQIHYSNAKVTDSIFRNNNEGVRFNRSNVVIEHNDFLDNEIGIRFVRLEGKAIVKSNEITNNNVGILFMQPHGKSVNFFFDETRPGVEPPMIANNNIYNNFNYNFKIGQRQSPDLTVANNWWKGVKDKEIKEFIFDKKDDRELGRVIYSPFLTEPEKDAGVRDARI